MSTALAVFLRNFMQSLLESINVFVLKFQILLKVYRFYLRNILVVRVDATVVICFIVIGVVIGIVNIVADELLINCNLVVSKNYNSCCFGLVVVYIVHTGFVFPNMFAFLQTLAKGFFMLQILQFFPGPDNSVDAMGTIFFHKLKMGWFPNIICCSGDQNFRNVCSRYYSVCRSTRKFQLILSPNFNI